MRYLDKNMMVIGRTFALVFFLTTSGFTTVLYLCCDPGWAAHHHHADGHGEADDHHVDKRKASIPTPSYAPIGDGCHTWIIAGGLNTIPALLEKESKVQAKRMELSPTLVSSDNSLSLLSITLKSYSPSYGIVSPPAREKYVLTHSFLI